MAREEAEPWLTAGTRPSSGWKFTRRPKASAVRTAYSTAVRLTTGSTPGMPWQISHVWLLGGAPNVVGQPQNIFERVASCA